MQIQANCGEMVYDFLQRALEEVNSSCYNMVEATHNTTTVRVYQNSLMEDLCDKFDMQRSINLLRGE